MTPGPSAIAGCRITESFKSQPDKMSFPIHLVLDEADPDPKVAVAIGREIGVESYAVRTVRDRRYPFITEADHALLDRLRGEGCHFNSVSPGIGKRLWNQREAEEVEGDEFPLVLDCAQRIGARDISIFSWLKPATARRPSEPGRLSEDAPQAEIAELLHSMAVAAAAAGLSLSVEVGYQCWADSGRAAWALIEAADHPALRIAWDPCNALSGLIWWSRRNPGAEGMPGTGAYLAADLAAIVDRISAVHVRDMVAIEGDPGWGYVLAGRGIVGWTDLARHLRGGDYRGPLTIEHHMPAAEKEFATRHTAAFITRLDKHDA